MLRKQRKVGFSCKKSLWQSFSVYQRGRARFLFPEVCADSYFCIYKKKWIWGENKICFKSMQNASLNHITRCNVYRITYSSSPKRFWTLLLSFWMCLLIVWCQSPNQHQSLDLITAHELGLFLSSWPFLRKVFPLLKARSDFPIFCSGSRHFSVSQNTWVMYYRTSLLICVCLACVNTIYTEVKHRWIYFEANVYQVVIHLLTKAPVSCTECGDQRGFRVRRGTRLQSVSTTV